MNIQENGKKLIQRKKSILDAAKVFLAVMLILTFFSKSIYSWTLPKVIVESVGSGSLTKEITGDGIVEAKGRVEYYTDLTASVSDIKVSEGDKVKEGDVLIVLDKEDLQEELTKNRLELEELELQREQLVLEAEGNSSGQLDELKADMDSKEKDYTDYKVLFESGAESKSNLEVKKREFDTARFKYESALKEQETETKKNVKELAVKDVDISLKEVEINAIENDLKKCVITAMSSGIIKEINFKKGMPLNSSKPVYILDDADEGFQFKADLPRAQCEYIKPGDEVKVSVKSGENEQYSGVVKAINDKEENIDVRTVIVDLDTAELTGGEAGELYIRKSIDSYDYMIPRSALRESSDGDYVFILIEKEGPLGSEYYVVKQKVTVGDSDYSFTGIYSGLMGDERIITSSNKDLSDGCRVMLKK